MTAGSRAHAFDKRVQPEPLAAAERALEAPASVTIETAIPDLIGHKKRNASTLVVWRH